MSPRDDPALWRVATAVADRAPVDWDHEADSRPDLRAQFRRMRVLETLLRMHPCAAPDPLVGTLLSHYRILQPIGAGGMGLVYLAEDVRLGRQVAIKVLPPELTGDEARRSRFLHEARAAAAVTHPNIATIHDVCEDKEVLFIVMELVKGETLRERVARGALPPKEVVGIAMQVCRGLDAAHRSGIIHRDVKPGNLAIMEDGTVKILDFGVALLHSRQVRRIYATSEEATGTLPSGSPAWVAGTISYMSPEQLAGADVDDRSDLFSLGVVIHELLTGERPFRGQTSGQVAEAILHENPPSLSESTRSVDRKLAAIVLRCLAKKPADRFQNARDLLSAFDKWLEPTAGWRRSWVAVAAAAVLATSAYLGGWRAWKSRQAPVPARDGAFTIAVAPFISVTAEGPERGRAYQGLIEREIRRRAGDAPVRVLEGEIHEAIGGESQAREVGQGLGADVVCWGKLLGVGHEEEVEARITPIHRVEQAAAGTVEVSLISDPRALFEMIRKTPLDDPRQFELLGRKAEEIADVVMTLVGLAQIRAGQYAEASRTLAALKNPTADQRFYLGLAKLRASDRISAEALFRQVLAANPKHSGARLGVLLSRRAESTSLRDNAARQLSLDGLANDPTNLKLNAMFLGDLTSACVAGEEACHEIAAQFREHFFSLCDRPDTDRLPPGLMLLLGFPLPVLADLHLITAAESPTSQQVWECRAFVAALEREPYNRAVACMSGDGPRQSPAESVHCCEGWHPDPYTLPPILYEVLSQSCEGTAHAADPSRLMDLAARDPRLEERVRDWACTISMAGSHDGSMDPTSLLNAVEWLRRHPGTGIEAGPRRALEGTLLTRAHRLDEAERAFTEAEAILGTDQDVQQGLAICHLAAGQFERALTDVGDAAIPERPLLLASAGRIRDAYQVLNSAHDSPSAGGTRTEADHVLTRLLDSVVLEIEKDETVRRALTSEIRRRTQEAASNLMFSAEFGFRAQPGSDAGAAEGIQVVPTQSIRVYLDYALPSDALAVLSLIQSVASSPGGTAGSPDAEHLAAFVERLSSFVRDAVSDEARK